LTPQRRSKEALRWRGYVACNHKHLASTVHGVDDEIIGWLKRREQRRRDKTASAANK
jgi:hypothetical protein